MAWWLLIVVDLKDSSACDGETSENASQQVARKAASVMRRRRDAIMKVRGRPFARIRVDRSRVLARSRKHHKIQDRQDDLHSSAPSLPRQLLGFSAHT